MMISLQKFLPKANVTQRFRKLKHIYTEPKTSLCIQLKQNEPGSLMQCLTAFSNSKINLTRIESRPENTLDATEGIQVIVDFDEDAQSKVVQSLLKDLKQITKNVTVIGGIEIPYFPRFRQDLDELSNKTLDAGGDLQADHPGFNDPEYRSRREDIAQIAINYRSTDPEIPKVEYSDKEKQTWKVVFNQLKDLHNQYAVPEHNESFKEMEKHCGYSPDNVPQLEDINQYLNKKTNFHVRPVTGLLTARDFLNALAFRTFYSTQYIRHHSVPGYTPEPDLLHELMGHVPLFANKTFADFSQEIGMASLGVTNEEINRLATNYWYSVEFGIIKNKENDIKVYGAGVLSSPNELKNAISGKSEIREWFPKEAAEVDYPISALQPIYWYTESFKQAQERMKEYAQNIARPFSVAYDKDKDCMIVDRQIKAIQVD